MIRKGFILILIAVFAFACATTDDGTTRTTKTKRGAVIGAVVGGVAGAVIGNQSRQQPHRRGGRRGRGCRGRRGASDGAWTSRSRSSARSKASK